jgi:hypothetical protein
MDDVLRPFVGDVFHLAPIPVFYKVLDDVDVGALNAELIAAARAAMPREVLEVPDDRHRDTLGQVPDFTAQQWKETHPAAVGIWHRVPTNAFLELQDTSVAWLKTKVLTEYVKTLQLLGDYDGRKALLTESWIQFYQRGDQKVLHNHERYDAPWYEQLWAGAYYLSDGSPDPAMKYSGVFSFKVRGASYFIKPRPGLLMMWPADVLHEVHPFYGTSERVVINFNLCLEEAVKSTRAGMLVRRLTSP